MSVPVMETSSPALSFLMSASETGSLISTMGHLPRRAHGHGRLPVRPAAVGHRNEVTGRHSMESPDLHPEHGRLAAEASGPYAELVQFLDEPLLELRKVGIGIRVAEVP